MTEGGFRRPDDLLSINPVTTFQTRSYPAKTAIDYRGGACRVEYKPYSITIVDHCPLMEITD